MDHRKGLGMKGPVRQAPALPAFAVTRYSPVTNWNDDPFGADLFEPAPSLQQKKKPPPRPPPPKVTAQPDIPAKPSHFSRRPTILSSLMSRKDKTQSVQTVVHQRFSSEYHNEVIQKTFPKCEAKSIQTASLIDLSSPPSSPTFTTRSSSDGLSVDSFGSDLTSSTNQQRTNNGNTSQAESGFEDDFDLLLSSRKTMSKDDTMDDFTNFDPFSPVQTKPPILKKPSLSKINNQLLCNGKTVQPSVQTHKVPTIIRAKPTRPKPPESSALLKMSLNQQTAVPMNLNMSVPIERIYTGNDNYSSSSATEIDWSPEREWSPPMPCVPPPPPPVVDDDLPEPILEWPSDDSPEELTTDLRPFIKEGSIDVEEPYAVALYDYLGDHPDDLSFQAKAKVKLIRRIDDAWLFGRVRSGAEGVFPANHVEIRVPLPGEVIQPPPQVATAIALYDFQPSHPGDLRLVTGDEVLVVDKVNDDWYFGECNGNKGQFPANYVQMK